jgi:serine/threonine protein kinase
MIFFNIINFYEELKLNHDYELIINNLCIKKILGHLHTEIIINKLYKHINENNKLKIIINKYIGEGSYGKVFLVTIDNNKYALKFSSNEIPDKMLDRYNSLIQHTTLAKNIVEIYGCGIISTSHNKTKYFSLMEYGGVNIKKFKNINNETVVNVLKQIYNIVEESRKNRKLLTDFKASNIIINPDTLNIKLIDIYMVCENHNPCYKCKIVRTYPSIEFDNNNRIYEHKEYNFTAIYVTLAITLIDILCKSDYSTIAKSIIKKYDMNIDAKQLVILLQIASYNYNNNFNNKYLKYGKIDFPYLYPSLYKYKKEIENKFPILSNNDLYLYFINNLELKVNIFSKKKFIIIINSLITICPNQRSIKYLKKKIFKN